MSSSPESPEQTIAVPPSASGQRLDAWLGSNRKEKSRAQWKELIEIGLLLVNQQQVKPRFSLQGDEVLCWQEPELAPTEVLAEEIPLSILHEDEEIIVINKPSSLVVHPADGNPNGTLVNALLYHTQNQLSSIGAPLRPGIVHRLDKDTSGVIIAAKTDSSHEHLVTQFAERKTTKLYLAVCQGVPHKPSDTIFTHIARHPVQRKKMAVTTPPNGKPSITDYRVITTAKDNQSALLLCHLHTGRTHQIRVHTHHLGHPLLGDVIYAKPSRQNWQGRLLLHAWHLEITHPKTKQRLAFTAPIPTEYHNWTNQVDLEKLLQEATTH